MIYALLLTLWFFFLIILKYEEPELSAKSSWLRIMLNGTLAAYCVWLPMYFLVLLVQWVYFLTTGIKV
jgi:hypothetical protein